MKRIQRSLSFFLVLLVFTAGFGTAKDVQEVDLKRNQLVGYILDKQLPAIHFSHKKMDASLSAAAFELYLKQLDYQKRFLLQSDVTLLRALAPKIADNLDQGTNVLPESGYTIMKQRVGQVEKMVDEIMAAGLDVSSGGLLETDPEKIAYAEDLEGLSDRWRRILKYRVITRYINLAEENKQAKDKLTDDRLWQQAEEKEGKSNKDFFLRLHQETLQDHYDRYFNAIAMAFDPHTNYLPPSQRDELDIMLSGNLEGIGALLREENGLIKVISVIPGSPAAKQGRLQAEDTLLQVAEKGEEPVDLSYMRIGEAVKLIRGPKGTQVRLTVKKPDGTILVIAVVRDVVQIEDTFVKDTVLEAPGGGKIGYILIPSFYRDFDQKKNDKQTRNATDDTRKAIARLEKTGVKGIILDLRNDGGGSLTDAVDVAGLFIQSGPVVQVKDSDGQIRSLDDDDKKIDYGGPLVVLVNQFSASASEIVAAALQDYKRAVVVGGEQTHGKGTVQAVIGMDKTIRAEKLSEVGDLGALKVTVQKFYRVTGGSTQAKGVVPDIVLPSLFNHLKTGEKYLDNALPWDQVGPAPHTPFRGKAVDVQTIRQKSQQRVERDPGLQLIAEEAVKADERNKDTAVSLALPDLRRKIEATKAEQKKLADRIGDYTAGAYGKERSETEGEEPPAAKTADWQERLKQDPYVGEAKNIIVDMAR